MEFKFIQFDIKLYSSLVYILQPSWKEIGLYVSECKPVLFHYFLVLRNDPSWISPFEILYRTS